MSVRPTREQLAAQLTALRASLEQEERVHQRSSEQMSRLRQEISRVRELLRIEPPTA